MRYPTVDEILRLHALALEQTGGADGLRDKGALESAVHQPSAAFGGTDLYPTIAEKAGALGYSLIMNHPFVDGNKRVGYGAMETLLVLNGWELNADVDDSERITLALASGELTRQAFVDWIAAHLVEMD